MQWKEYKYSQLKNVIKVGDLVRASKNGQNNCSELNEDNQNVTELITRVTENGFSINGCYHTFDSEGHSLLEIQFKTPEFSIRDQLIKPEAKVLLEAELIDDTLELNEKGLTFIASTLFNSNKGKIVAEAKRMISGKPAPKKRKAVKKVQ